MSLVAAKERDVMKNIKDSDLFIWLSVICGVGLLFELFFRIESLFLLGIAALFIYLGMKQKKGSSKKVFFIIGISFAAMTLFISFFFKAFLFIAILYFLYRYWYLKKKPTVIHIESPSSNKTKPLRKKQLFFKNILIGDQRIEDQVYEWDDINIQCGIGDIVIDLGMTMLPLGENILMIRGVIGNIRLLIPHDTAIIINHSALTGMLKIDGDKERLLNGNVIYHSDNYEDATRKVKIITSLVVGDVEVKYI